uniref:N-acetylglucosaminyl-phosphatidylinositol n=1 Tax=Solanum tuberosum TaxID=4113 RepID=M1AVX9_SOLTU
MRRHHLVPGRKKAYDSGASPIGAAQGHLLFKHNVELGFRQTTTGYIGKSGFQNGLDLGFDCHQERFLEI